MVKLAGGRAARRLLGTPIATRKDHPLPVVYRSPDAPLADRVTVTALLAAVAAPALPAAAAPPEAKARSYVVVLRDGRDSGQVAAAHGRRYGAGVDFVYGAALRGDAARIPAHRLSDLRADPDVAFVSEDLPVSAVARRPPPPA